MEDGDHRAGGLAHDLGDQLQCVLRARSEPDERDVGALPGRRRAHLLHVDLPRDHVVAETDDDVGQQLEAVALLVRDQDAQVLELGVGHRGGRNGSVGFVAS